MKKQNKTDISLNQRDQSTLDLVNQKSNEINYSFSINDISEMGQIMKKRMQKSNFDNELNKICQRRDSLIQSENSLYERNINASPQLSKAENQESLLKDAAYLAVGDNKYDSNDRTHNISINDENKQEDLIQNRIINQKEKLIKNSIPIIFQPENIEIGTPNNGNSFQEQAFQNTPPLYKQNSKRTLNQESSLTQKTGQNDSSHRKDATRELYFQACDFGIHKGGINGIHLDASQIQLDYSDNHQSKKRGAQQNQQLLQFAYIINFNQFSCD